MTQALDPCITEVVNILRNVDGIKNVPLNPPALVNYDTFAIVYPSSGNFVATPTGTRRGLHNIAIDVLTKDLDIARSIARLRPLIDSVPLLLIAQVSFDSNGNVGQQFNNTIETFEEVTYNWIPLTDYGGVPVVGLHFAMTNAKVMVNL
jgi:hypothetical protein